MSRLIQLLTSLAVLVAVTAIPATGFSQQALFNFTPVFLDGDIPGNQTIPEPAPFAASTGGFLNETITDAGVFGFADLVGGTTVDTAIVFSDGTPGSTAVVLVQEGQNVPGSGTITFNNLSDPIVNNNGDVAFSGGDLRGADSDVDSGYFFLSGTTGIVTDIAREGSAIPGSTATFGVIRDPADPEINDSGQVLFTTSTRGGINGFGEGAFLFDSANAATPIVEIASGDTVIAAASGGGTYSDFAASSFNLNESGNVAFQADVEGGAAGDGEVVVTFDSVGGTVIQARQGDAAPGGGVFDGGTTLGEFDVIQNPTFGNTKVILSDANQLVFQAAVTEGFGTISEGLFYINDITNSASPLQSFLRTGDSITLDGQSATVDEIITARSSINASGQFVIEASLTGSTASDNVLLLGSLNTPGQFTVLAREGNAIASGSDAFFGDSFDDQVSINDAGQVLFQAAAFDDSTGTRLPSSMDSAIFFYDPALGLLEVVREGDASFAGLGGVLGSGGVAEKVLSEDGSFIFEFQTTEVNPGRNGVVLVSLAGDTLLGDVNLDGMVDFLDISPFIVLLTTQTFQLEADVNEDGAVDFLDISPFIGILAS